MLRLSPGSARLLMTTDSVGGVWRYAMDACSELARRGNPVALVGMGPPPAEAQRAEAERAGIELSWLDAELDWLTDDAAGLRAAAKSLDAEIRRWRPDILHLNAPSLAGCLSTDVPCVAAVHSCVATWWSAVRGEALPDDWNWYLRATADGLKTADVVVTPTRAFADQLRAVYGDLPRLRVVGNAARPVTPHRKQGFAFAVGRWWDDAKNVHVLDQAAEQVDWPMFVAGPLQGPNGAGVTLHAAKWVGEVPNAEIRTWMARTPIFVSTALYEPFGLGVLEAAGAGAALVLSDISTFRELWGGCALFVDPDDPAETAAAINALSGDPLRRARLAKHARERAGACSLARQADALFDAYAAAADRRLRAA